MSDEHTHLHRHTGLGIGAWLSAALLAMLLAVSIVSLVGSWGLIWGKPLSVIAGKGSIYRSVWITRGAIAAGGCFVYEPDGPGEPKTWLSAQWAAGDVLWWPRQVEPGSSGTSIAIPLWMPAVVAMTTAACCWWPHVRRWQYGRQGRCTVCGYSCRGLAGSTCPECGEPQRSRS